MTSIRLIVGLGNPGSEYEPTRHNAGFWFVDRLARRHGVVLREERRYRSETARTQFDGHDCRLQKPLTYMNHSGQAVVALAGFHRITPQEILVAHDDLDLPPGAVRLKRGGGHGGHNGLRDLFQHLGGGDFLRLRIGIGHPGSADQVVDYVLTRPSAEDRSRIEAAIDAAVEVMPLVLDGALEQAMNRLHGRKPPE